MSGKYNSSYDSYVGLYVAAAATIGGAAAIAYLARYSLTEDEAQIKALIGKRHEKRLLAINHKTNKIADFGGHDDAILLASNQDKPMGKPRPWDPDPANKKGTKRYRFEVNPSAQLQIDQFKHPSSQVELWPTKRHKSEGLRVHRSIHTHKQEIVPKS